MRSQNVPQGRIALMGAPPCACAVYTPPLRLIKLHDCNLELYFFFPPAAQAASVSAAELTQPAWPRLPSAKCFNVMQVLECKFQIFLCFPPGSSHAVASVCSLSAFPHLFCVSEGNPAMI